MAEEKEQYEDGVDENFDPEAECATDFKPVKELQEVTIVTGEEQEDVIEKFRTKLYRWRETEFKERGTGDLKFLKHKETGRIRILMRQDKTHKVVANFIVSGQDPLCKLVALKTNEKSWVWSCYDFSDNETAIEKLCGRFTSVDEFNRFKTVVDDARASNKALAEKKEEAAKEEPAKEEPKAE